MQTRPEPTPNEVKALEAYVLEHDCLLYKALRALFPKLYEATYQYHLSKAEAYAKANHTSAIDALRITSPASFAEYWRIRGSRRQGGSYSASTPDYSKVVGLSIGKGKVVR